MNPIKNFLNLLSKSNITENKNNTVENKNTKFSKLNESEILLFDSRSTEAQFNDLT
jgi:hypothetical protein